MKKKSYVVGALIVFASLTAISLAAAPPAVTQNPRGLIAVGFLDMVFNQRKVQAGFDQYAGAEYKQHNPYAADGKQAAIDFLSKYLGSGAEYRYDFKHVYVDGRTVIVHSHVTRGADDRGSAVVDIFRLDRHNRVVEHWDVVQPIPEKSANDNTMF